MTEKELAVRLVRNAISTQKRIPAGRTDANQDPDVRAAGNAAVAHALELLGKHGVVVDVQPSYGIAGAGFAYTINPATVKDLADDDAVESHIEALLTGPITETAETIRELLKACESRSLNAIYREDLLASLRELDTCFGTGCFIACLALSGKILEICLKQVLLDHHVAFEDKWMIGQLLKRLQEAAVEKYIDQSLGEVAIIINRSRIPAVHAKEKIPFPSREQAVMVIHAVADTIN